MSMIILGLRKLNLQRLELKSLSDMKDSQRYKEQKAVLQLLLREPEVLFTTKHFDSKNNKLYKYTNHLNRYTMTKEYYNMAVKFLK
ncbi:hypothetical protein [Enterococcus sp. AZ072]|uniref:hypothetical protein n=1 Tax=unclassified Enterococcus TaxID=2608891 RepID=UPI003D2B7255